jgi:TrmH family RNA methyltransferase
MGDETPPAETRIEFVLLRPARPANVAASCRAMKNMGFAGLRLVDPPTGLGERAVRALAYGAWDVLDGAAISPSLEEAVAGASFVVGTTGRPEAGAWTPHGLGSSAKDLAAGGRLSLVFGPESSGMSKAELALCHATVHIPTDRGQPSLNLAQAVLVLAYELRMASLGSVAPVAPARATVGEMEQALEELSEGLLGIGYLNPQSPGLILSEIRRLLARAAPSSREVSLIRGVARQIRWAAGRIAQDRSGDS